MIWKKMLGLIIVFMMLIIASIIHHKAIGNIKLKNKINQIESDHINNKRVLNSMRQVIMQPKAISWEKLGLKYHLATQVNQDKIYYAGSTENILALLDDMIVNAYQIKQFDVNKSDHKTLLTIQL